MPVVFDDEKPGARGVVYDDQQPQPRSWMDATNETIEDTLRAGANAVSFGMADRLRGYLEGTGTDAEVKKSEEARARSPIASVVGDVAGSVAIPGMGGARLAANLGTRFGPGALRQFGARALGYGAEGAGVGAAQGAGNTYTGNVGDYVTNALTGGALGGAAGGVMGGILGPRGQVSSARPATIAQQQHFTDSAYDLLRANPTHYDPAAFNRAAQDLEMRMLQRFDPAGDSAPASFRGVDRMQRTQTVTPKSIEDIRIQLNQIDPIRKTDRTAAREVKNALDDFMINPPRGAVHPSQTQSAIEAAETAAIARAANAGLERSRLVNNARQAIDNKTARTYSGLNAENNMRAWADRMVSPNDAGIVRARVRGFDNAEQAAMRNVLHPGYGAEALRWSGNLLGAGGGLGALTAGGLAGTGSLLSGETTPEAALKTGATLAAGLGLRGLANRAANRRMQTLEDLVGMRNPLAQRRNANAPMVAAPTPGGPRVANNVQNMRDAITYTLLQRQPAQEGANVP